MPLNGNAVKLISGTECAFYIDNGSALLGVDSDSKDTFEILNWTASGVNGINAAVQSLGDGRFLYYDAYTTFLLKPSSVPYDQMVTLKLGTMDAYDDGHEWVQLVVFAALSEPLPQLLEAGERQRFVFAKEAVPSLFARFAGGHGGVLLPE